MEKRLRKNELRIHYIDNEHYILAQKQKTLR